MDVVWSSSVARLSSEQEVGSVDMNQCGFRASIRRDIVQIGFWLSLNALIFYAILYLSFPLAFTFCSLGLCSSDDCFEAYFQDLIVLGSNGWDMSCIPQRVTVNVRVGANVCLE